MQWEDYFDFSDSIIRLKGHRIGIEHILAYYRAGFDAEEIAAEFPGVSLDKIYATITYYLSHRREVDAYLVRVRERAEQDYQKWAERPSPLIRRLQKTRAQQVQRAWNTEFAF